MTKVLYNDQEIELVDELELGEEELDKITPDNSDTIEFVPEDFKNNHDIDMEKTKELKDENASKWSS